MWRERPAAAAARERAQGSVHEWGTVDAGPYLNAIVAIEDGGHVRGQVSLPDPDGIPLRRSQGHPGLQLPAEPVEHRRLARDQIGLFRRVRAEVVELPPLIAAGPVVSRCNTSWGGGGSARST